MTHPTSETYVSRGGDKLAAALDHFKIDVAGCVCADLGSHVGGFVDCLLRGGATRVFAVDTCYGTLAWKLRHDPRVVVLERTNAMHVSLPEPVDIVTLDVGWTTQPSILPNVTCLVRPAARVVTLIKPHYEAHRFLGAVPRNNHGETIRSAQRTLPLVDGVLPDKAVERVVESVLQEVTAMGWTVCDTFPSPIRGHAGNREVFALLTRRVAHLFS